MFFVGLHAASCKDLVITLCLDLLTLLAKKCWDFLIPEMVGTTPQSPIYPNRFKSFNVIHSEKYPFSLGHDQKTCVKHFGV